MNESSFSLTTVNNLLKLSRIEEASSSYCDGITVELDEAKLGSCSYGWVRCAFGLSPPVVKGHLVMEGYFFW